jgi:simple sugar transport system ATP-binding protein
MRAGLGLVPEDRKHEGIIPNLSVRENIVLALQAKRGIARRISMAEQRALATRYITALRIAAPNMEARVGSLSGGNQQKVVLARWLAAQPTVLILDEPTRGVDVGAKAEIDELTAELCRDGLAIILIASEIEDVARQSHRVLVLRDRRLVGELVGEAAEPDRIMRVIAGEAA